MQPVYAPCRNQYQHHHQTTLDAHAYAASSHHDMQHAAIPYFAPATYPLLDPGVLADAPLVLSAYDYSFPASLGEGMPAYQMQAYAPPQPVPVATDPLPPHTYIHAPVPVSAYSPLLANHASDELSYPPSPPAVAPPAPSTPPYVIQVSPAPQPLPIQLRQSFDATGEHEKPRDTLEQYDAPQVTFPTPSDLLNDSREQQGRVVEMPPPRSTTSPVRKSSGSSSRRSATRETRASQSKGKARAKAASAERSAAPTKTENLRKSYFRSVADKVGFQSTDPDTITSHDKKRHYLESLEQYIVWLDDFIEKKGLAPQPIRRVDSHQGLNSQSIRTLLLHMETKTKDMHAVVTENENRYFAAESWLLHDENAMDVNAQTGPAQSLSHERARRHSIANGMIPMCAESHIPALPTAPTSNAVGMEHNAQSY